MFESRQRDKKKKKKAFNGPQPRGPRGGWDGNLFYILINPTEV